MAKIIKEILKPSKMTEKRHIHSITVEFVKFGARRCLKISKLQVNKLRVNKYADWKLPSENQAKRHEKSSWKLLSIKKNLAANSKLLSNFSFGCLVKFLWITIFAYNSCMKKVIIFYRKTRFSFNFWLIFKYFLIQNTYSALKVFLMFLEL